MEIYMGNLSYQVKEADLKELMQKYSGLSSVKLIVDRISNRSKGFAFAVIEDDAEAERAIEELNGAEFGGRKMVVREATPAAEKK